MGLIEKDGMFLLGIEAKDGPRKGKWRLLGGKLEGDETAEHAMIRECMEEAEIKVEVTSFLGEMKGDKDEIIVDLCHSILISGDPKPATREIEDLKWFSLAEAKSLDSDRITKQAFLLFEESLS
jgi:8-oxo-dGTP diphosphatase